MNYFMSLDPLALFRSMPGAFAQGMVWGLMALVLGEDGVDYGLFKEQQYDKLAATLREYLDLDAVYKMMREYE